MQRVRCIRFPPIEAMLRSCGDALASSACEMAGKRSTTTGCTATSLMRASAPMRMPSPRLSTVAIGSALMSTTCDGCSTSFFIRSMRFVPPATNFVASREPSAMACGASEARA